MAITVRKGGIPEAGLGLRLGLPRGLRLARAVPDTKNKKKSDDVIARHRDSPRGGWPAGATPSMRDRELRPANDTAPLPS